MQRSTLLLLLGSLLLAGCGHTAQPTQATETAPIPAPTVQPQTELNGTLLNFDPTAPDFDPAQVFYDPRGYSLNDFGAPQDHLVVNPRLVSDPPADYDPLAGLSAQAAEGAGIVATNPIPLTKLSGTERTMAQVYNARAGYFDKVNSKYGVMPSVMAAVMLAESGSAAYTTDWASLKGRRMTIRFENHHFFYRWGQTHADAFNRRFKFNTGNRPWEGHYFKPTPTSAWTAQHTGPQSQSNEWAAFDLATQMSSLEYAALSTSMGMGQVMGFNYAALRYPSAAAMYQGLQQGAEPQLDAIVDFFRSKNMIEPMKRLDFMTVATLYNGPGKAADYAADMQKYFEAYKRVLAKYPR